MLKEGKGKFSSFFLLIVKSMNRIVFAIVLVFVGVTSFAQYTYDFNKNCTDAYTLVLNLKFDEGQKLIDKEKQLNPDNNIPYLIENYIYFLKVFIGEEESVFEELDEKKDDIIDRLEDGDESSPYYNYSLAQVYLQWAFARTKFKEYFTAALEINRAYRRLEKNEEKFPDFLPDKINMGLLHTMIGTIPDSYNWIKKVVGVEGTVNQGTNEILQVLDASLKDEKYTHFRAECLFYLSFIKLNLSTEKDKALDYINMITKNNSDNSYLNSPLTIYAMSRIYMGNGMTEKALSLLLSRPKGKEYYPFYYLDYLTGLAKLQKLDKDANIYFLRFLDEFKGVNYIKAAYQKIAWYYAVNGNTIMYKEYIAMVKDNGYDIADADKQAEREAERDEVPNAVLLKARLLFDGGYYERALKGLTTDNRDFLKNSRDSLEYTYRIGRIYHGWGKIDDAIPYYKETIQDGSQSEYYYASNSALQLGLIYEKREDYQKAGIYYEKARSMENEEYKNSIDQKAKAGLNRIEDK